jgi:archaellum component FlaC
VETVYSGMSDIELKTLLTNTQYRLDDKEDELHLMLGQSQSGQHISGKYIQSYCERLEQDIKPLKSMVEGVGGGGGILMIGMKRISNGGN